MGRRRCTPRLASMPGTKPTSYAAVLPSGKRRSGGVSVLIGLDIGTTGARALAVDETGAVVADASAPYPLLTPHPGWAEQHPEDWWRAAQDALRQVTAAVRAANGGEIVGLGLTGQMHGAVFLDAADSVIRPALLWNDQRTEAQCARSRSASARRGCSPSRATRRYGLSGAENPLAARGGTGELCPRRARGAAERLHPPPAHWGVGDGCLRCVRHTVARCARGATGPRKSSTRWKSRVHGYRKSTKGRT